MKITPQILAKEFHKRQSRNLPAGADWVGMLTGLCEDFALLPVSSALAVEFAYRFADTFFDVHLKHIPVDRKPWWCMTLAGLMLRASGRYQQCAVLHWRHGNQLINTALLEGQRTN